MLASLVSRFQHPRAAALLLVLAVLTLALATPAPALAREIVPTPAGGGAGVNEFPADQQHVLDLPRPDHPLPGILEPADRSGRASARGDIGGDDMLVMNVELAYGKDLAIASDGTIFAIIWWDYEAGDSYRLTVRRSTDGGTTWSYWATFDDSTPGFRYWDPVICVAEGDVDRVFVAYGLDDDHGAPRELHVAWSPLDLPVGDFSNDTVVFTGHSVHNVSFTTDAAAFSEYFAYVVWSHDSDYNGADIAFARSTDQGTTWESPYDLANIAVSDRGYYQPKIAVGYGGWVHVAWHLDFDHEHEFDDCLRYRRAPSYAGGGLAAWEPMQSLTSHLNDVDENGAVIAASWTGPDVMIACDRAVNTDSEWYRDGIETRASDDAGAGWSTPTQVDDGSPWVEDLIHQQSQGRWLMSHRTSGWGFRSAPVSSPADWSEFNDFADDYYISGSPAMALDPSRGDRIAVLGGDLLDDDTFDWLFDAEWRADPGYPNLEAGFPVDLPGAPVSDPAVVDLDGDGDQEIVFAAQNEVIFAYHHDGTEVAGFPLATGFILSDSPVCVGDLNGDGAMEIVVGTMNGVILAYDADANLLPGWPYVTGYDNPVYLAIGAIGGPYPRAVIWECGPRLAVLDFHGDSYPGTLGRGFSSLVFSQPPSIGDIDGDGRSEVVVGIGSLVYGFRMMESGSVLGVGVGATVSGPLSLGDFDLDGDMEIVVPTEAGEVHLLQGDGSPYPGSWPVTAAAQAINGAAVASCLGNSVPEIAVSARGLRVSVLWEDGEVASGFPVNTDGWNVYGMPVIGEVEGSNDIIIGARGNKAWSWSNTGQVNDGWPRVVSNHIYQTPAYGDLDQDGSAEVVFLTLDQLVVVDVNNPPSSTNRLWAMAGHDHERSGCADCSQDVVAVGDDPLAVTRVSMAAPYPNPVAGEGVFRFAVPVRAIAELTIYDVRGRQVALVSREEVPAGRHVFQWHGRDGQGRQVASGQYVARLTVRGPGLDEQLTRKVTVLR